MTFIDDRNFPGGPAAFNEAYYPYGVNFAANTTFVILNWVADGLLVNILHSNIEALLSILIALPIRHDLELLYSHAHSAGIDVPWVYR